MQKELIYRNYKFLIIVNLDSRVERRLNGKSLHHVMVSGQENNFLETNLCEDLQLESSIDKLTKLATDWVDENLDGKHPEDKRLINLGFKYVI